MVVAQRQTGEEGKRRKKNFEEEGSLAAFPPTETITRTLAGFFFLSFLFCIFCFSLFPKVTPDLEEMYVSETSSTLLRELETNPSVRDK